MKILIFLYLIIKYSILNTIMDKQTQNRLDEIKLASYDIKKIVINEIYTKLNVNLFKYKLFDKSESYDEYTVLKKYKYFVTPHIIGINYIIVLITYENDTLLVGFNKKYLKPNNEIDINTIDMQIFTKTHVTHNTDKSNKYNYNYKYKKNNTNYNITMYDGKLYVNDDKLTYNIFEMYINNDIVCTSNILKLKLDSIKENIEYINSLLDTNNNFIIKISSIYELNDLPTLVYKKIKQSSLKINGLIFIPEKTNKIFIYINDNEFNQIRKYTDLNIIDNIGDFSKSLEKPIIPLHAKVSMQLDIELNKKMLLKSTKTTDVYEVYNLIENTTDYTLLYNYITENNRIGIAHIPDIATSHHCKKLCNNYSIFIIECSYNKQFDKWQPIV